MAAPTLAYLKIVTQAPGTYTGGLMVVDARGLPLDFRYTEPVAPTKIQQVLYGKSLDRHVRQEVIFKHLAVQIEYKPALLLVDDELLLGLHAAAPVVMVVETRLGPLREVAHLQELSETEFLLQVAETGSPMRFKLARAEDGAAEQVADLLLECARLGLDPTEPFGRVRGALDQLCEAP